MKEFTYIIRDPDGIHARPAGLLVNAAKAFKSSVTLKRNNISADAKKIFSVMRLAAKCNEAITINCFGEDEEAAALAIATFFEANL